MVRPGFFSSQRNHSFSGEKQMKDETNVSNISLVGVCPFGYVMRGGVRGDCIFSPDECKWNQAS